MIDSELREHAEDLYVVEGMTFEEVAGATGVHIRTIQGWSAEDEWRKRRQERVGRKRALKESLEKLAESMVAQAETTKHSQDVHAAIGLAKLTLLQEKKQAEVSPAVALDHPRVFLENLEFVAGFLKDRDPEGLKILARNFDALITAFKERNEKTT